MVITHSFWQVDAFTDVPFKGNPAVVCIVEDFFDDQSMLAIAREMNVSETVFLKRIKQSHYHIRWFTPKVEVDLCGHATLSAAHVLWQEGMETTSTLIFASKSGELKAHKNDALISLNFPLNKQHAVDVPAFMQLVLNGTFEYVGASSAYYVVKFETPEELYGLKPNFVLMAESTDKHIIVTSPSDNNKYDYLVRFFAPRAGINEDPVTGSAQTVLFDYWHKHTGKSKFTAYQASERGGALYVSADPDGKRVNIAGHAVTVLKGMFEVPIL